MKPIHALLAVLFCAAGAAAAEEDSFDASAFEKRPFELGGYAQFKYEDFALNRSGAQYKLNGFGQPQRDDMGRATAIAELVGKLRHGTGTFDFRTHSDIQRDQVAHGQNHALYEAAYSLRPSPGATLEAGKRVLRWGKGYAWNPIGFVERPKDPNDPDLAREGFVIADADLIVNRDGPLQTIAFTPVLLPVRDSINGDFGARGHWNPAAKLYLLYRDIDLDIAWQGKGSRPARYGAAFAANLASNFEIHGEWARINGYTRPLTDAAGVVSSQTADATSYLLGLRYLTQTDVTYIAEYYRNGTGYSEQEFQQFYTLADSAIARFQQTGNGSLVQKALALSQGSYGRPNPGTDYLYFRAQQKDALGIVYFQLALFAILNMRDRSFQVTPELSYSGVKNWEFRARAFLLHGDKATDFGEKQNARKFEVYARYYF